MSGGTPHPYVQRIAPSRLKPGDVVAVEGLPGAVFAVLDVEPGGALVTLQSQHGTRLKCGWKALRWPTPEVAR
jgi:hypothetical protein